jgi:hypothetical protein
MEDGDVMQRQHKPVLTTYAASQKTGTFVVKRTVSKRITVSGSVVCVASHVTGGGTGEESTIFIFP